MTENYLEIMEESLQKKIKVLDEIAMYNNEQEQLLKRDKISLEELDKNMELKDALIQKLMKLDEGFEILYGRIREQLQFDKTVYKEQIRHLQSLIALVTEKSVSVQAQEARNKKLIEDYFINERSQLRQGRKSSKAAYGYYKNMSNGNVIPAQFMDQKNNIFKKGIKYQRNAPIYNTAKARTE